MHERSSRVCWFSLVAATLVACGSSSDGGGSATAAGGAGTASGGTSGAGAGGVQARGGNGGSGGANPGGGTAGKGGASASGGTAASGGAPSSGGAPPGTTLTRLPDTAVFYQDVSAAAVDPESTTILAALQTRGWGDAGKRTTLGVDFSFEINVADPGVPRRSFTQDPGALPDCDTADVPLPPGGKTEGSNDYACSGGDCHLIVYQGTRLYELYQSDVTSGTPTGGTFTGSCLVVWDLTRDYWQPKAPPNFSRGDGCNGADAGDMPIAPLLLTEADLAAGVVDHALRFTISNNRIRAGVYVHPATHIGGPSGGPDTLPYGARLRLRASYDVASLPNDAARAVATALKKYGMFLADGGNIYISATTGASDSIGGSALGALTPGDFEMVDGGTRIDWHAQNCTRTPVSD